MAYIKTLLRNYYLGDQLYYSEKADRYILASCEFYANAILEQMQFNCDDLKVVYNLTDADKVIHRKGSLVHIHCRLGRITAESALALGVPSRLDTTKPLGELPYA